MRYLTLLFFLFSGLVMANNNLRAVVSWANGHTTVEVAETFEQRQQGLQHRQALCHQCGMLFVFEESRVASFWMKNTSIPLDIAYIDSLGRIARIKPLTPFNEKSVSSDVAVKYALEMNQGWFAANQIKQGDVLSIQFVVDPDTGKVSESTH